MNKNIFYYVSIFLIAVAVLIAWAPFLEEYRTGHPDLFAFCLTMIATFLGVFLAIEVTRRIKNSKEIEDDIKLLTAAEQELIAKKEAVDHSIAHLKIQPPGEGKQYIRANQLRFPNLLMLLISSELMLKQLDDAGIALLYRSVNELQVLCEEINSGKPLDDAEQSEALSEYKKHLNYILQILKLEVDMLKGIVKTEEERTKRLKQAHLDSWPW